MKIAVMGCGTVGSGVVDIFDAKKEKTLSSTGEEISVKYILDIRDFHATPYDGRIIKDIDIILSDPEIETVVETMGGKEPAFSYCKRCMEKGKNIVTANKELVAARAPELFSAAQKNDVSFMFEGAVCGGIPVVRAMFSSLSANNILSFAGIFNGTTNFILTKMINENLSFSSALKEARRKGYAEKDPAADIEGLDSCRKTCILASIAFGAHIFPEEVHTEGITSVTLEDAEYAANALCKIKLLGQGKKLENGKISAIVAPFFVPCSSLISAVDGVNNACLISGDSVGDLLFYGRGAGKEATASAVASDVMESARIRRNEPHYSWKGHSDGAVEDFMLYKNSLFIRGYAKDGEKSLAEIREVFGGVRLLSRKNAPENELAFITPEGKERELRDALKVIRDFVPASTIRYVGL